MQQAIIPRTTLTQLVAAWRQCEQEVNQAFALLDAAGARLKTQFRDTYRFNMSVEHCTRRYSKVTVHGLPRRRGNLLWRERTEPRM